MHRYFIELSYNGTNYHGWQIQPNATTVQAVLMSKLSMLLRADVDLVGCGRTDTGVHARSYFAHMDTITEIEDLPKLCYKLNGVLPFDISIHRIFKVDTALHARFSATSRTYRYYISTKKNPFLQHQVWEFYRQLDVEKMNSACAILLQQKDFAAFAKAHSDTATTFCDLIKAEWSLNGDLLIFEISANRFLRNMVRAIVGTLVEVGLGNIDTTEFTAIVQSKNRSEAGFSVPACGLFLENIDYNTLL